MAKSKLSKDPAIAELVEAEVEKALTRQKRRLIGLVGAHGLALKPTAGVETWRAFVAFKKQLPELLESADNLV
jgi:hypothetical protein